MRELVLILALSIATPAFASGFSGDEDDDTPSFTHPDDPDAFLSGELDLISNAMWPRWRAMAFRVLTTGELDETSRASIIGTATAGDGWSDAAVVAAWHTARAAQATTPSPLQVQAGSYGFYFGNCYADAFVNAKATLDARVKTFGAQSKEVREWIVGQDAVFASCEKPNVPPPDKIGAGVNAAIQKDRDYQIAAALFYAQRFPEALVAFDKVGADASSPWSTLGRFAAARTLLRAATTGERPNQPQLADAEKRLTAILADPKAKALHASAERLVRFVAFRLRPETQLAVLGELLAKRSSSDLGLILTDFAWLADRQVDSHITAAKLAGWAKSELTEWTMAWDSPVDGLALARHRYKEKKTLPWLVLELALLDPKDPEAKQLLEDARTVKRGSPAFLTVARHRVRLLVGAGRIPAARALLDELLGDKDVPSYVRNVFLDARWSICKTMEESLAFLYRTHSSGDTLADAARGMFLQFIPIVESAKLADDPRLPTRLHDDIYLAAWTRAALLEDLPLARRLATELEKQTENKGRLAEWRAAKSAGERRYAIVHEWLSRSLPLSLTSGNYCGGSSPDTGGTAPPFVPEALTKRAAAETARIDAIVVGAPSTWLATEAAAWATAHKDDPRVPDDLSRAVKGTRGSCDGKRATAASKKAWQVLHKLFPDDPATKETKYWYP